MQVSVIIPTLNAERQIKTLLQALQTQTRPPDEVIVIDSDSEDKTPEICRGFASVNFIHIERRDFDHGGTRDKAFNISKGDFVLFLTQDALPSDSRYVENILRPFGDEAVAMVTGRQVANKGSSAIEQLTRGYNYPEESFGRSKEDIPKLGIKTFFASNCCSAYRRTAYLAIGGFSSSTLISEDLVISARLIYAGYKTFYCGDARVTHSHDYTLRQQYSRNFDTAANIAMHKDLFSGIPVHSEGISMAKYVLGKLLSKGRLFQSFYFCFECAVKWKGYSRGLRYSELPKEAIAKCSMHPRFWEREANSESQLCKFSQSLKAR